MQSFWRPALTSSVANPKIALVNGLEKKFTCSCRNDFIINKGKGKYYCCLNYFLSFITMDLGNTNLRQHTTSNTLERKPWKSQIYVMFCCWSEKFTCISWPFHKSGHITFDVHIWKNATRSQNVWFTALGEHVVAICHKAQQQLVPSRTSACRFPARAGRRDILYLQPREVKIPWDVLALEISPSRSSYWHLNPGRPWTTRTR